MLEETKVLEPNNLQSKNSSSLIKQSTKETGKVLCEPLLQTMSGKLSWTREGGQENRQ